MSAFGGKADIDQPLLTNLDLWVDALKTPLSHYFWGAGGSGAPTWLTSPSIWGRILKSDRGVRSPAALIAGAMALGFGAVFFGLVITFPLIGHATWHAFRDLLVRSDGS